MYIGIGSIQYQRVVSCVTAEDTLGVGEEVPPASMLYTSLTFWREAKSSIIDLGFFVGVPTPPYGPQPSLESRSSSSKERGLLEARGSRLGSLSFQFNCSNNQQKMDLLRQSILCTEI
jgi:hypothetical protein